MFITLKKGRFVINKKIDMDNEVPLIYVRMFPPLEFPVTSRRVNITFDDDISSIPFWMEIYRNTQRKYELDAPQEYVKREYMFFDMNFFAMLSAHMVQDYLEEYRNGHWMKAPEHMSEFTTDMNFIQKVSIPDDSYVYLIGDIHSSFHSMMEILDEIHTNNGFEGDRFKLKKDHYIVFLGDIVDRGPYGLECLALALVLKQLNWGQVHIINGNHEDFPTYTRYGLSLEMKHQFGTSGESVLPVLKFLPLCIYLNYKGRTYHLSHGAYDYHYDQSGRLKEFLEDSRFQLDCLIEYPATVPPGHSSEQYKWGDFNESETDYDSLTLTGRHTFGREVVEDYLRRNKIECLITGHQDLINLGVMQKKRNNLRFKPSTIYGDALSELKQFNETASERFVTLIPRQDFMAMVTSTAVISRQLPNNTYLLLR